MVGFDVPTVAHDMMLRFMGVDLSLDATLGTPARLSSSIGGAVREGVTAPAPASVAPVSTSTTTPEQDKARWECKWRVSVIPIKTYNILAYYNAGSAALIFLLICLGVGICFFIRQRRNRPRKGISLSRESDFAEEHIPLQSSALADIGPEDDIERIIPSSKGKAREIYTDDVPSNTPPARSSPVPPARPSTLPPEPIFDVGDHESGSEEESEEEEDEDEEGDDDDDEEGEDEEEESEEEAPPRRT